MKRNVWTASILVVIVTLIPLGVINQIQRKAEPGVISVFGKYQGYSQPIYDGSKRTSDYLTLSDGTRLAYDLIIPTQKGVPAGKPLPVLFKYTPYGRAWTVFDKDGKLLVSRFVDLPSQIMLRVRLLIMGDRGRVLDPLFRDSWLGEVTKHGYIVVSVDRPGTGASFAGNTLGSMETALTYENEIINWIAAQPWSDGNVAMYGDSQQAMVQFAAAAAGNPHLKAILPAASDIQIYQAVEYPGGVYNQAFAALVSSTVPLLDQLATPVDNDPAGVLLEQARISRQNTASLQNTIQTAEQYPFQDSVMPDGIEPWQTMDLYPFIDRINHSKTAVYMTVGWYDIFTADMFYWYNNLTVPRHLTVRPTDHSQVSANLSDLDYGSEALRWLDYWLKGIENGIMDEPPIHYYAQDGNGKGTWQTSSQWPLNSQKLTRYYFSAGKSGSIPSINDGFLNADPVNISSASDPYTVDYTATTGTKTRWGAVEEAHQYPDLRAHDARGLTYTTQSLLADLEVTGHPVVSLWLSTDAPDLDVFVYLEAVDPSGKSAYVTEGVLRASHRKLGQAPFNTFGLPYQTHLQADQERVPSGQPFELCFSLLPTSYRFNAGSRMRVTVAFADSGNFATPVLTPAPKVQVLRDIHHPSYIDVPTFRTP